MGLIQEVRDLGIQELNRNNSGIANLGIEDILSI
jgi:hypothetical protein